jgi:two-component system sensor histidine kinase KdpD
MFFMIAMLNGVLTSRIKQQEEMAKDREKNVNTMLELTLEREYLAELAQKARFLDESDRLYKTLFNSISHELRIPVATIMGAAESLITLKHTAELQEELSHEIFTASMRLNRVIENLLNMSRLESGRISLRADWHDINDLINKVSADLEEELKNFVLVVEIPDDMPLVRIDFGLMEQVLYNLLFNSAEYSPAGSEITIEISHANNVLAIKVLDSGPGFPADKISSVFNKFFRVENSKSGGLGLGLSIVKGFVEAHKGTITVENRKEGGAGFTINIPSEQPEIAELIN